MCWFLTFSSGIVVFNIYLLQIIILIFAAAASVVYSDVFILVYLFILLHIQVPVCPKACNISKSSEVIWNETNWTILNLNGLSRYLKSNPMVSKERILITSDSGSLDDLIYLIRVDFDKTMLVTIPFF